MSELQTKSPAAYTPKEFSMASIILLAGISSHLSSRAASLYVPLADNNDAELNALVRHLNGPPVPGARLKGVMDNFQSAQESLAKQLPRVGQLEIDLLEGNVSLDRRGVPGLIADFSEKYGAHVTIQPAIVLASTQILEARPAQLAKLSN